MSNYIINLEKKEEKNNKDYTYLDISMISNNNLRNRIFSKYKALKKANIIVHNNQILMSDQGDTFLIDVVSKDTNNINSNNYFILNNDIDVRAVQNSLDNIFSWIPGERILNPEFGNKLYKYLYEGITQYNEELIVAEIKNCISQWEPRVTITNIYNISETQDTEDNTICLNIEYYINGLESIIYNKEYTFNRNE